MKTKEGTFDWLYENYFSNEKKKGKLIDTYIFPLNRYKNDQDEELGVGKYRVKVYHMDDDEFRANLYPLSIIDFVRYKWFTRKHFRIM